MMTIEKRLERIEAILVANMKMVLTVKEAAAFLNRSVDRVRHMVSAKEIPHYKNDRGHVYFVKSELEEWMLGRRVPTAREIDLEAARRVADASLRSARG